MHPLPCFYLTHYFGAFYDERFTCKYTQGFRRAAFLKDKLLTIILESDSRPLAQKLLAPIL